MGGWDSVIAASTGMHEALRRQRAEKRQESAVQEALRARLFDEHMRKQEFEQRKLHDDDNRKYLNEQREALAEQRRQNSAHVLAGDLAVGDTLDSRQAETLRSGQMGSNIEHQGATLPSRQTTGYLMAGPSAAAKDGRPQFSGGRLITRQQEGNPERHVWRGTPGQRRTQQQEQAQKDYISRLPPNHPARQALEYEAATGRNPPASMFPNAGDTTPWQAIPLYGEDGRPSGALRFNQRTGQVEPVELPAGAGIRAGTNRRGALPARVQNWILSLQQKHPSDYAAAQREFAEVMQGARDETFDRIGAAQALRSLYAQPTGQDDNPLSGLGLDLAGLDATLDGRSGGGRGAPPTGRSGISDSAAPAGPGPQVGERRQLRDGRAARITRVFPDGTVEVEVEE